MKNNQHIKFIVDVMFSCKKIEQFWSWLDWTQRLKIDSESKKMIYKAALKFSREKWPISQEMEKFRNVKMLL